MILVYVNWSKFFMLLLALSALDVIVDIAALTMSRQVLLLSL